MWPDLRVWDVLLVLVVSVMATSVAYVRHPRAKAVILNLPIPFTLANLALGRPVGPTHVLGLWVLLLFTHGVRWLHVFGRVPIVLAIALAAAGYCLLGGLLAAVVPDTDTLFWTIALLTLALGAVLHAVLPHRQEPGHRSPMPIPAVAVVISFILAIRNLLQGFMTLFPMVGVVAAYEARHSLWTITRQIPVLMITLVPMHVTVRLTQDRFGLGGGLALGWVVFLVLLIPVSRRLWREAERQEDATKRTEGTEATKGAKAPET